MKPINLKVNYMGITYFIEYMSGNNGSYWEPPLDAEVEVIKASLLGIPLPQSAIDYVYDNYIRENNDFYEACDEAFYEYETKEYHEEIY